MKIIHLTNSDSKGGAARACYRIHKSLQALGEDSYILTQQKLTDDDSVVSVSENIAGNCSAFIRKGLDWLSIESLSIKERGRFTFPFFGTDISKNELLNNADIISLHWINEGFLSLNSLKKLKQLNKTIIWTFHDMWAFTGGCHYAGGCEKYLVECRNCPALKISGHNDQANKIFNAKKNLYNSMKLSAITCSNWLANEARNSELLKERNIHVIPNPIETDIYIQHDKIESRKKLNLQEDKFLILFVSMTVKDERKGFSFLINALKKLYKTTKNAENIQLLILGAADESLINDLPFKVNLLGRLSVPTEIAECYSAADLFVAPSLEDNLPNTVMESLSCCTPVIAFNIGGMPDMIEHKQNGYLAKEKDEEDLMNGILWYYNLQENEKKFINANARQKVLNNFTSEIVGKKYQEFYRSIL